MPKRSTLNVQKALSSKLQGNSYHTIAKQQNVPVSTVHHILAPLFKNLSGTENIELYQRNQAAAFDGVSTAILASISDADLSKATLQAKVTSIAILTDKQRLVSGQSTANLGISVLLQGVQSAGLLHATPESSGDVIEAEVIED